MLFLAFGVVPHQFIDHADKDLGWSRDKIIFGPGGILKPESAGGWNPITLQYEAVRDIVVVILHLIFIGLYIYLADLVAEARRWSSRRNCPPRPTVVRW